MRSVILCNCPPCWIYTAVTVCPQHHWIPWHLLLPSGYKCWTLKDSLCHPAPCLSDRHDTDYKFSIPCVDCLKHQSRWLYLKWCHKWKALTADEKSCVSFSNDLHLYESIVTRNTGVNCWHHDLERDRAWLQSNFCSNSRYLTGKVLWWCTVFSYLTWDSFSTRQLSGVFTSCWDSPVASLVLQFLPNQTCGMNFNINFEPDSILQMLGSAKFYQVQFIIRKLSTVNVYYFLITAISAMWWHVFVFDSLSLWSAHVSPWHIALLKICCHSLWKRWFSNHCLLF